MAFVQLSEKQKKDTTLINEILVSQNMQLGNCVIKKSYCLRPKQKLIKTLEFDNFEV